MEKSDTFCKNCPECYNSSDYSPSEEIGLSHIPVIYPFPTGLILKRNTQQQWLTTLWSGQRDIQNEYTCNSSLVKQRCQKETLFTQLVARDSLLHGLFHHISGLLTLTPFELKPLVGLGYLFQLILKPCKHVLSELPGLLINSLLFPHLHFRCLLVTSCWEL